MASNTRRPQQLGSQATLPHRTILTPPPTPYVPDFADANRTDTYGDMAAANNQMQEELDLFFLTFNCAKTPVDVDVFARHLSGALGQRRTNNEGNGNGLPDLVVLWVLDSSFSTYNLC